MTHICERLVVHCPDQDASRYLAAFVAEHQVGDGSVHIALRPAIVMSADRRSLIERRVVATLNSLQSINDPHPTYSVTWLPKGDGPSPEFAGALAVESSPQDDCFSLILSGDYEPFGGVGAMFGASRGRRIAHVSGRDVLRSIANQVETARAHNDAAHAGRSPLTCLPRDRARDQRDFQETGKTGDWRGSLFGSGHRTVAAGEGRSGAARSRSSTSQLPVSRAGADLVRDIHAGGFQRAIVENGYFCPSPRGFCCKPRR